MIQGQGSLGLGQGRFGPPPTNASHRWGLTVMNGHSTRTRISGWDGVRFPTKPEKRASWGLALRCAETRLRRLLFIIWSWRQLSFKSGRWLQTKLSIKSKILTELFPQFLEIKINSAAMHCSEKILQKPPVWLSALQENKQKKPPPPNLQGPQRNTSTNCSAEQSTICTSLYLPDEIQIHLPTDKNNIFRDKENQEKQIQH